MSLSLQAFSRREWKRQLNKWQRDAYGQIVPRFEVEKAVNEWLLRAQNTRPRREVVASQLNLSHPLSTILAKDRKIWS